ncbi:MAG: nucleotide exchange factor GrpE [Candidatus Brocadiia bacterium]
MGETEHPEFALNIEPLPPDDPARRRAAERAVLGMREKAEHFYREMVNLRKQSEQDRRRISERVHDLFLDLIEVADSFEDVFGMCEDAEDMEDAEKVAELFRTTYETLLRALQKHGVHRVPVLGKRYDQVEYEGTRIPEPFEVVDVEESEAGSETVRKVIRSLWIRVVGNRLLVLRKAQVVC